MILLLARKVRGSGPRGTLGRPAVGESRQEVRSIRKKGVTPVGGSGGHCNGGGGTRRWDSVQKNPWAEGKGNQKNLTAAVFIGIRRRPTLPDRYQSSTIGTEGLNFCVRYGNRWDPFVIATGNGELCFTFPAGPCTTAQLILTISRTQAFCTPQIQSLPFTNLSQDHA